MYLHLGRDIVVREEELIGIFDLENTSISKETRAFLKRAQEEGEVVNVTMDLPKSFCVCADPLTGDRSVYLSQLSPATLEKRIGIPGAAGDVFLI